MAGCSMLEMHVLSHIAHATIHVKQLGTIDNHANKEAVIFARCRDFQLFQMINIFSYDISNQFPKLTATYLINRPVEN